jgi:hypothetical protein
VKNLSKNSFLLFLILLYTAVVFADRLILFRTAVQLSFQSHSVSKAHKGPASPPKLFASKGKFVVNTQKLLAGSEFVFHHSESDGYQDNLTAIHHGPQRSHEQTGITQHLPRDPPQG